MDAELPESRIGTSPETHVYHVRFWRVTITGLVFAQLLFGAYVWVTNGIASVRDSMPLFSDFNLVSYVFGSLGITVLLFLLLVFFLPVKVSAANFSCPNGFGTMVTVPWDEVTRVRSLPIPGFPYLLVSRSGR